MIAHESAQGVKWFSTDKVPCRDTEGNIIGTINFSIDITERKKAEAEVAWLASFPMLDPNPIVEVDLEGIISYANSAAERAFPDLKKAGLSHPFFSGWQQMFGAFKDEEKQTFSRDIEIGDAWFNQQFHIVPETHQVRIYTKNITEAKKTEQALVVSEVKYRELVDFLPEMVFEIDTQGNAVLANKKAFELTAYSQEDLKEGFNVNRIVAPEDIERLKDNMQKVFAGAMRHGNEYTFVRKDGTRFPVTLSSNPVIRAGKIIGARGIVIDITERKKAEEQAQEAAKKLKDAERLAAIGTTAGMVGHDIRNPLQAIAGDVYLAKTELALIPESDEKKDTFRKPDRD